LSVINKVLVVGMFELKTAFGNWWCYSVCPLHS